MHVLLLKEPRDGDSGPDPYIKVRVFALLPVVIQNKNTVHLAFTSILSVGFRRNWRHTDIKPP